MKLAMPASVLVAELGIGAFFVYHVTIVVHAINRGERLSPLLVFGCFALSLVLLVGIARRNRLTWRSALTIAAIFGGLRGFDFIRLCLIHSSFGHLRPYDFLKFMSRSEGLHAVRCESIENFSPSPSFR